jgi:hypothetical protein
VNPASAVGAGLHSKAECHLGRRLFTATNQFKEPEIPLVGTVPGTLTAACWFARVTAEA